jgi:hypothetical protein
MRFTRRCMGRQVARICGRLGISFTIGPFLVLAALLACNQGPINCTLIGCGNSLTVVLSGAPIQAQVTIVATGSDGSTKTRSCVAADGYCSVSFDFSPPTVTLQVSYDAQTTTRTIQPAYTINQPNGPRCGPTCRSATVSVAL